MRLVRRPCCTDHLYFDVITTHCCTRHTQVHAIAALLKGNTTVSELNLRGNAVTYEGARALAAVISGRTGLRAIDLRGNAISKQVLTAT